MKKRYSLFETFKNELKILLYFIIYICTCILLYQLFGGMHYLIKAILSLIVSFQIYSLAPFLLYIIVFILSTIDYSISYFRNKSLIAYLSPNGDINTIEEYIDYLYKYMKDTIYINKEQETQIKRKLKKLSGAKRVHILRNYSTQWYFKDGGETLIILIKPRRLHLADKLKEFTDKICDKIHMCACISFFNMPLILAFIYCT